MGANKPVTLTGVADNAAMMSFDYNGKAARINPFSASQLMSPDAKASLEGSKKKVKPVVKRRTTKKGGKK